MSSTPNNFSRVPLNVQHPSINKSGPQKNPSWESFRSHEVHKPQYNYQGDDKPSTHMMSLIRRNPDGQLDYDWAKNMIVDAIHNISFPHALLPIHQALLTVVFPNRFRVMEPMQANLQTQLSDSEKAKVKMLVENHLLQEANYSAGRGGGNLIPTRDGTP